MRQVGEVKQPVAFVDILPLLDVAFDDCSADRSVNRDVFQNLVTLGEIVHLPRSQSLIDQPLPRGVHEINSQENKIVSSPCM